ncbi:hypothetical protein J6590_058454 [Homalodisca vitripennis]|nr:hypothetical protein J6590_058454 [Homalodisca vitripennis]
MIIVKKWQNELRDYHVFHVESETSQAEDTAGQSKERRIAPSSSKMSMTSKRSRYSIISVVATPDLLHEAANQHLTWYQRSVFCVLIFNTIKCIVGVCILVDTFIVLNWMIKICTIVFFMITIVQAISSLLVAIYLENKVAVILMAVLFSVNLFSVVVLWSYYTEQTTS